MSPSFRTNTLRLGAGLGAAVLVALLVGLPTAQDPVDTGSPQAALRVQLDPETGEFVPFKPGDQPGKGLANALNRSAAGLQETRQADGGVALDLEGRFQSLSVATVDSSGQVKTGCVTNERELREFMGNAGSQQDQE